MPETYIAGRRIVTDPALAIGEGGEAEVFDISAIRTGEALKVWKPPNHPDFAGSDERAKRNREGAKLRLDEYQDKLRSFPKLPSAVVSPIELAWNRAQSRIVGYSMKLVTGGEALRQLCQRAFRERSGVSADTSMRVLRKLHSVLDEIHGRKVVVADFSYLNVLYRGEDVYLIDADSMQFGRFLSKTFTIRFVDPLICDQSLQTLVQMAPHSEKTDWYAYAVMLFESLLFVHPYGGIYEPLAKAERLSPDARPLRRISVFHKGVTYPVGKALPLESLEDDILHYFYETFESGKRERISERLLDRIQWTRCKTCGMEHAREVCPKCKSEVPQIQKTATIKGQVSATRKFYTTGVILQATVQNGKLLYLYHEDGQYKRESDQSVFKGGLSSGMRYKLLANSTCVAGGGKLVKLDVFGGIDQYRVQSFRGGRPQIDTNAKHLYWLQDGSLYRDDQHGPKRLGDVLPMQTQVWVGPEFGFGFYKAESLWVGFVFDAERSGINDSVSLPRFAGEIVDASCYFSAERAWFFIAMMESGRIIHHCTVLTRDGQVITSEKGEENEGWLGSIRAKYALTIKQKNTHHAILSVSDQGIVRIEEVNGKLVEAAKFPDSAGLISPDSVLLASTEGLYVVDSHEIKVVRISP